MISIDAKRTTGMHLLAAAAILLGGGWHARAADAESGKDLVGTWEMDYKGAKVTQVFEADGTGKNNDGSRFRWKLKGEDLIARPVGADGKLGDEVSFPIAFTRDRKEYSYLVGGEDLRLMRITWYKLDPQGRRYAGRSEADRAYPQDAKALKDEAPEVDGPEPIASPSRPGPMEPPSPEATVRVGPNVQVSRDRDGTSHGEVVIAADASDPKRLLAASMFQPPPIDPAAPKVVVYASVDGGATWRLALEHVEANPRTFHDPTLAFAADGSAYLVDIDGASLAEYRDGSREVGLRITRTRDDGKSWEPPARIEGFHDRPFLTVDCTGGRYRGRLYIDTQTGLFVSADDGTTFGAPKTWPARPGYNRSSQASPAILSDGSLVLLHSFESRDREADRRGRGYLVARRSTDGGSTFSEAVEVASFSTVEGRPDGVERVVIPVLAADSRHGDRLYAAWPDADPDGRLRVYVSRSSDRGTSWTEPALVSEQDRTVAGGEPAGRRHDAFLPSIAVNREGVVGVAWYDTRVAPDEEPGWQYRFRASLDGGAIWRPSVRVSERWTTLARRATGHTSGLAASADGVFHPLWIDGRTGRQQVWTAAVRVGTKKIQTQKTGT